MDRAGMIREKIETINAAIEKDSTTQIGLMTGLSGLALYYYTLFEVFEEEQYARFAVEKLETVFEILNDSDHRGENIHYSFCSGLAGVGYAANLFAREQFVDMNMAEDFAEIDRHLFNTAIQQISDLHFSDWMHGGMGVLKYFLQRASEPVIENYCHEIVNALFGTIRQEAAGTWFPNFFNNKNKNGEINFSLSHGQCGILLILCEYVNRFKDQKLIHVIESGAAFLLNHQRQVDDSENDHCIFPFSTDIEDRSEIKYAERLGWCYGDLNEVLLLHYAGTLTGNSELLSRSLHIGKKTTGRLSYESTLTQDSHFCHGMSGLAAFYRTLYMLTGDNSYGAAHSYWIEKTIQQLEIDINNHIFREKEFSLIDGYAGIGAVLASSLTTKKTEWTDVFLLS